MQRVETELERLIDEIKYEEVNKLFSNLSGGKRLRAKLVLKIASKNPKAPLLAAIIELIHAASLLHDDVIDEADTRRGKPSVNATEGSKIAVMFGDILYSKGFSELVEFEKEIAKRVASSVTQLSVGEMMDVAMGEYFNTDEKKYLDMLYLKTATLIEAAAASAAILAGKDPKNYALYGRNLGLSFQIIDDILDITSDEKTLGKPAMNDFYEGKMTLPYIYLYEDLPNDDKLKLKSLHKKVLSSNDIDWIKSKMKQYHSIEKAYKVAQRLSDEAKKAVDDEELRAILDKMIQRSY
ncbi:MAG: polyprenyl synthetase family protein [Epsilonproteobacteria bacterium]|nr:polyprenyl synthetase family protein [Campylobacterota bacterium]